MPRFISHLAFVIIWFSSLVVCAEGYAEELFVLTDFFAFQMNSSTEQLAKLTCPNLVQSHFWEGPFKPFMLSHLWQ